MVQNPKFQFGSAFEEKDKAHLASPLDRLAATVVDALILLPLVQLLQAPFKKELIQSVAFEDVSGGATWRLLNLFTLLFVFWMYNTFSIYFFSQTLGKKVFGLKVVSFRKHVSLYSSVVRSSFFFLEMLFLGLPFVALFTHPWRRALHDRLSDTVVIGTKRTIGYPSVAERKKAYAFTASFVFFFSLSALFYSYLLRVENMKALAQVSENEECRSFKEREDVSVAKAIKHFSVKNIDSDCLKEIAKDSLWKNKDKALANLASSFAHHDQEVLSMAYLERVCEIHKQSKACLFSQWVRKNPIQTEPYQEEINTILSGQDVEDFYRVYFISALQSHNLHQQAQKLIGEIREKEGLVKFLSLSTFRALLWQKKWEPAYWVYKTNEIEDSIFVGYVKKANAEKSLSPQELTQLLKQFYPSLELSQGRAPASRSAPVPTEIRGLWMRLKEQK